jgi:hypothetical protein
VNGITYHHCISIDFCGLAATTLLYPLLNRPEVNAATIEKRKAIRAAFEKLFTKDLLHILNRDGYYLRVRFCFAYLYSDFPICLMKAEQSASWKYMGDVPIRDYYINKPLNGAEFRNSGIRTAQEASLREIIKIISGNDDIVILGGQEKRVNTIQVRFCAIPASVCVLLVNDTAYYDLYLYGKTEQEDQLALLSPVVIVRDGEPDSPMAFTSFRKHFNYLWRHDLTLFCSDATRFTPENIHGLTQLLPPDQVIGDEGTNWAHKEARIWDTKEQEAGHELPRTPNDERRITEWKENLNNKLTVCTRMIHEDKPATGTGQVFIAIGAEGNFFTFTIECREKNITFKFQSKTATLLYCVIAHYSYARRHPKNKPILHTNVQKYGKNYGRLRDQIIKQLNSCDLDKDTNTEKKWNNANECFDLLFSMNPFQLIVPPGNIQFDESRYTFIETAKYPIGPGKPDRSCLQY